MYNKNLIRFDWAMKRLLRNKANFSVLEGFLSELFRKDLKINKLLESESNQSNSEDKFNRVDILAEAKDGELMIIEIQNQSEFDYFQRMVYGTAKVISENIHLSETYKNIRKVYSINIVYFDLGQGEDYVYHGKTDFKGIHKDDLLSLSDKQKEMFAKDEPYQIFPEYYVIKVNQFDDVAKDTLDEWIYYLKNNEIPDTFSAKGLSIAKELLRVDKLSDAERSQYNYHIENLRYKASMLWTWKIEAEDLLKLNTKLEVAKNLKEMGISIEIISKSTGIKKEEIEKL